MGMAQTKQKVGGLFYGWYIVLASLVLQFLGSGVYFYGFAVFFNPISSEFGWTRAETSGAFSLARLEGGPMAPIVGWLVDRFGPRRLMIFGVTVAGLGFIGMAFINGLVAFYIIYGLVISLGFNFGFGPALSTAIANWFIKKRGRAFSIYTVGAGLGGGIVVPAIAWLIGTYGWRSTAIMIAISLWIVGYPVSVIIRHRPEQYGLLPDGDDPSEQTARNEQPKKHEEIEAELVSVGSRRRNLPEANFLSSEAMRTAAFWLLVIGFTFRSAGMTAVVVHEVPFLVDIGISEQAAATALGMMTLISLIGRLAFGYIGDFIPIRFAVAVTFLLQAVGLYILTSATGMDQVWLFLVLYGIGYGGAIPLQSAQIAEYFGRMSFGTIIGLFQLFMMAGTVFGPIFAGYVYDTTNSYNFAFITLVIGYVIGAVFIFFASTPTPSEQQLNRKISV